MLYAVQVTDHLGAPITRVVDGPVMAPRGPRGWHGAPGCVVGFARAWALAARAPRWRVLAWDAATDSAGCHTLAAGFIPGGDA